MEDSFYYQTLIKLNIAYKVHQPNRYFILLYVAHVSVVVACTVSYVRSLNITKVTYHFCYKNFGLKLYKNKLRTHELILRKTE